MNTIFVVSPNFLEAIFQESKKYEFRLQGYGTFKRAKHGIILTNAFDILGIAFVGISLPARGTSEYEEMMDFIFLCNLMKADKKFVFLVQEGIPLGLISKLKKFTYLKFFQATKFQFMSDLVINRSLFASILLNSYEPYELTEPKPEKLPLFTCPVLSYQPVINEAAISCLSAVDVLDSFQHTIERDRIYLRQAEIGSGLQYLRAYYIAKHFNVDSLKLRSHVLSQLDLLKEDTAAWCTWKSLVQYIDSYNDFGGRGDE